MILEALYAVVTIIVFAFMFKEQVETHRDTTDERLFYLISMSLLWPIWLLGGFLAVGVSYIQGGLP